MGDGGGEKRSRSCREGDALGERNDDEQEEEAGGSTKRHNAQTTSLQPPQTATEATGVGRKKPRLEKRPWHWENVCTLVDRSHASAVRRRRHRLSARRGGPPGTIGVRSVESLPSSSPLSPQIKCTTIARLTARPTWTYSTQPRLSHVLVIDSTKKVILANRVLPIVTQVRKSNAFFTSGSRCLGQLEHRRR